MTHTHLGNILWGIVGTDQDKAKELLDIIPTGIAIATDTSCQEVIHNAAASEFLRVRPWEGDTDKAPGSQPVKLYHHGKAVAPSEMPLNRAACQGEKITGFEIDYIWEDGVHKTAIWNANPLFDERGTIIGAASTFKDITRRRQAEETLRQSKDRYHALVTASLDVVYRMSPDWRVMYYLQGRDFIPDTCSPNSTWIDRYVHPDDQPRVTQVINEAIRTKGIFELIHRVQRIDGTLGWAFSRAVPILDDAGEIIEWFGMAKDVTVRKEAQEKLAFQSHVLDSMHDAVIAADKNLIITYWNRMAEKMFGWTEKEAIGQPLQGLLKMIIPGSTWDDLLEKTIAKGCFTGEIIHHHRDGREIYGESHAKVIKGPGGECQGYVASLRDITVRKRMEQALRDSEKKYRHLFNSIDVGFCIVEVLFDDKDQPLDYRFLEVNQAFRQQTGLADPIGRCMRDMVSDCGQHWSDIFGNIALTGKPARFQKPAKAFGCFYDVYAFPTGEREQRRVGILFHDIMAQKQAEAELQIAHDHLEAKVAERTRELSQERQRLFDILETLPISICLLDADYRIPFANRAFREMFGLSDGRRCYDYIYGFSEPCWFCQTYRVLETGKPLRWKSKTPGGHIIDVYDSPFIDTDGTNLILEMSFDITEQENAIQALHQSEERFAKIFYHSPVLLAIIRMRDNVFIDVNQKFTAALEYSRQEVLGQTPVDLNIWAGDSNQTKSLVDKLQEKGMVVDFEYRLRAKSGKIITILLSTATMGLNGELCRLSLMKDITAEKKLEAEMARLDRLNLVGEMAAGIGHEVRNPMTTVRGFLQLLGEKERYAQDKGYLTLMIDELDRANSIISEFLALARNRAVNLEMKDLNKILHSILPLIQADGLVTDKYIELKTLEIPALLLDEKEIRQLVLNLVRNGMQAMKPGQTLIMETFMEENKAGDAIVLAVRDQGTGIPPEIADKIGNPFFTTKDSGTGLGLSVCYSIAARHKAAIDFETSSTGTTFFVRFEKPL
ncbi:MAG: PAS domain S-box protein [Peptococcaceae bacterium]|nr:PAS domain S-box protein [Candidatus Syntrophopropionicum ammoniitolerans]